MKTIIIAAATLALAACSQQEPESVEQRADNLAAQLESRANELEAAAENGVNAAVAELDAEFPEMVNGSGNAAEDALTNAE